MIYLLGSYLAYQDYKDKEVSLVLSILFYFLLTPINVAIALSVLSIILKKIDIPYLVLAIFTTRTMFPYNIIFILIMILLLSKKFKEDVPFVTLMTIYIMAMEILK